MLGLALTLSVSLLLSLGAYLALGQDRASCEDRLAVSQKDVLVIKASREQLEQNMALLWVRFERAEQELKAMRKAAEKPPEPAKEGN